MAKNDKDTETFEKKLKNAETLAEKEKIITQEVEKRNKIREKEAKTVKGLTEKYAQLARDAKMSVMTNDQIEMQNQGTMEDVQLQD